MPFLKSWEQQAVLMIAEGLNVFNRNVNHKISGKNLIDSDIRQKTGCTVIAIAEGDKLDINPDSKRVLKQGEEIVMIGTFKGESRLTRFLKMKPHPDVYCKLILPKIGCKYD